MSIVYIEHLQIALWGGAQINSPQVSEGGVQTPLEGHVNAMACTERDADGSKPIVGRAGW